jgi:hypothetical protein
MNGGKSFKILSCDGLSCQTQIIPDNMTHYLGERNPEWNYFSNSKTNLGYDNVANTNGENNMTSSFTFAFFV